jgi:hypothetical protein
LAVQAGGPIGASLQTDANAGAAVAGTSVPAMISVVATQNNGLPLGKFSESADTLPTGWYLKSSFNLPEGGCSLKLADPGDLDPAANVFTSHGSGVYTIAVVSNCAWVEGDYHYMLHVNGIPHGSGGGRFKGSVLGNLEIPAAPEPVEPPPEI